MRPAELLFRSDQGPDGGLNSRVFRDFSQPMTGPETDGNVHHWFHIALSVSSYHCLTSVDEAVTHTTFLPWKVA